MLVKMHEITKRSYNGYTHCSKAPAHIISEFRNESRPLYTPHLKKEWYQTETNRKALFPKIKNIPNSVTHKIIDVGKSYQLFLPGAQYLNQYLANMENVMDDIKRGADLRALAHYMHLFVIAHPFEKINNSICMAQINTILKLKGYSDIFHKYLDFDCFVYDYPRIEEKFITEVKSYE
jgi:hypothetical protein